MVVPKSTIFYNQGNVMDEVKLNTQAPNKRKSRAGLSSKRVNLDQVHKKLLTSLNREANNLLRNSHKDKLNRDDAQSLIGYLKLIKDLRHIEKEKESELSDKELEEISKQKEVLEDDENE